MEGLRPPVAPRFFLAFMAVSFFYHERRLWPFFSLLIPFFLHIFIPPTSLAASPPPAIRTGYHLVRFLLPFIRFLLRGADDRGALLPRRKICSVSICCLAFLSFLIGNCNKFPHRALLAFRRCIVLISQCLTFIKLIILRSIIQSTRKRILFFILFERKMRTPSDWRREIDSFLSAGPSLISCNETAGRFEHAGSDATVHCFRDSISE